MFLSNVALFCVIITSVSCEINKIKLLKYKHDIDKVRDDFENFILHVVEEIGDGVDGDYYSDDETTSGPTSREILDKKLENTTQKSVGSSILQKGRWKRSTVNNSTFLSQEINANKNESANSSDICDTREQQHLEDLKDEVKKLNDLVVLLRDQQRVISLLDKSMSQGSDISSRFGSRDLLKILDYVNNKDIRDNLPSEPSSTREEIAAIKEELRKALDKTKDMLTKERKRDLLLEKELSEQRLDINILKMMVQKLYKNMNFHREDTGDDILGVAQHLPKMLPSLNLTKSLRDHGNLTTVSNGEDRSKLGARRRNLNDIERFLQKLNQPNKNDIESRISELQRVLERKKQEKLIAQQLQLLDRLEPNKKRDGFTDFELEVLKRLQNTIKNASKAESRSGDDEIESELQNLQDAIDNLRPKEDLDPEEGDEFEDPSDDMKQFRKMIKNVVNRRDGEEDEEKVFQNMLTRLIKQGSRKIDKPERLDEVINRDRNKSGSNNFDKGERSLLLREILELKRRLALAEKSKFERDRVPYGYGVPDFGRRLHQMELPAESYGPPYSPYPTSPYQNAMSHLWNTGGGITYQNPSKPALVPPYFTSRYQIPYEGFSNQNAVPENKYEAPNRYNYEAGVDQSPYQTVYDTSKAFNSVQPSENQQIPFTISVPSNQNKFGIESYPKTLNIDSGINSFASPSVPYGQPPTAGQNFRPQDRNQFFPPYDAQARPVPELAYPKEGPIRSSSNEPGFYPPKAAENVDHVHQKVEDMRSQIGNLQSVIDGLNNPNYTQSPQDRDVVVSLEKQVNGLKNMINNIQTDAQRGYVPLPQGGDTVQPFVAPEPNYTSKPRRKRRDTEKNGTEVDPDSQLYDQVVAGLKNLIFTKEEGSAYEGIQRRIDELKLQLESIRSSEGSPSYRFSPVLTRQPPNFQHHPSGYKFPETFDSELVKAKKNDVFTSVVLKIVDKILAAAPAVLERIFGFGFTELGNFGRSLPEGDQYRIDYRDQNDLSKLFRGLGIFGYGPLLILKFVDGFTTLVKILRRNQFFRSFLIPVLLLLAVAGSVVFLIWWLQPDSVASDYPYRSRPGSAPNGYYNYNEPYSKGNYHGNGYGDSNNNYGYRGSYAPSAYG